MFEYKKLHLFENVLNFCANGIGANLSFNSFICLFSPRYFLYLLTLLLSYFLTLFSLSSFKHCPSSIFLILCLLSLFLYSSLASLLKFPFPCCSFSYISPVILSISPFSHIIIYPISLSLSLNLPPFSVVPSVFDHSVFLPFISFRRDWK